MIELAVQLGATVAAVIGFVAAGVQVVEYFQKRKKESRISFRPKRLKFRSDKAAIPGAFGGKDFAQQKRITEILRLVPNTRTDQIRAWNVYLRRNLAVPFDAKLLAQGKTTNGRSDHYIIVRRILENRSDFEPMAQIDKNGEISLIPVAEISVVDATSSNFRHIADYQEWRGGSNGDRRKI